MSKLFAYWTIVNYREAYGIFASNGILFNHESPRRGKTFVTKKITREAARIVFGEAKTLFLGNLDAKRDWGFAPEFCEGMWRIVNYREADDFVLATGETHSVREFAEHAFRNLGIEIGWRGAGENEKGVIETLDKNFLRDKIQTNEIFVKENDVIIEVNPSFFRPTEVDLLIGSAAKAEAKLDWRAETKFEELVKIMIDSDLEFIRNPYLDY